MIPIDERLYDSSCRESNFLWSVDYSTIEAEGLLEELCFGSNLKKSLRVKIYVFVSPYGKQKFELKNESAHD